MQGNFLFLGTGGSLGVPVIGCECAVCLSSSSKNKRKRAAGLLQVNDSTILVDAGPDIREQLLSHHVKKLSGAILTHAHYDHIAGLDDIKAFYFANKRRLPCLLSQETFDEIKLRYHYLMQTHEDGSVNGIHFDFQPLDKDFGKTEFQNVPIEYLSFYQMGMKVLGFKIGSFAYVSDIKQYTPELIKRLHNIEILVLSALREAESAMHFSIEEAIAFARAVHAKRTYFTHIAHDMDHEAMSAKLPSDICLCYDSLTIPFNL